VQTTSAALQHFKVIPQFAKHPQGGAECSFESRTDKEVLKLVPAFQRKTQQGFCLVWDLFTPKLRCRLGNVLTPTAIVIIQRHAILAAARPTAVLTAGKSSNVFKKGLEIIFGDGHVYKFAFDSWFFTYPSRNASY